MPKGIMVVESYPASPEQAAEYHEWYNETHMPQILEVDGFVAARRFAPMGEDGPFVAIYEIEADDLEAARARLTEATKSGRTTLPVGVRMDPPPVVRYYEEIASVTERRS